LIIARLGHFKGSTPGEAALKKAIALVMAAGGEK
jgi:hypothetical protein